MKKQLQNRTVYKPNKLVDITVVNKPVFNAEAGLVEGYDVSVSIKVKNTLAASELKFGTDDEIADYLANIDVSEPQLSLGLETKA